MIKISNFTKTKYFYRRMSIIYLLESQKLPIFSYS